MIRRRSNYFRQKRCGSGPNFDCVAYFNADSDRVGKRWCATKLSRRLLDPSTCASPTMKPAQFRDVWRLPNVHAPQGFSRSAIDVSANRQASEIGVCELRRPGGRLGYRARHWGRYCQLASNSAGRARVRDVLRCGCIGSIVTRHVHTDVDHGQPR